MKLGKRRDSDPGLRRPAFTSSGTACLLSPVHPFSLLRVSARTCVPYGERVGRPSARQTSSSSWNVSSPAFCAFVVVSGAEESIPVTDSRSEHVNERKCKRNPFDSLAVVSSSFFSLPEL